MSVASVDAPVHAARMSNDNQPASADALRPLVEAIKAEIYPEILAKVRAELRAESAETAPTCVMLSIKDACDRYGVGRIVVKKLIGSGRLRSVEREARGGRTGQFLHIADCERVLAGRRAGAA